MYTIEYKFTNSPWTDNTCLLAHIFQFQSFIHEPCLNGPTADLASTPARRLHNNNNDNNRIYIAPYGRNFNEFVVAIQTAMILCINEPIKCQAY